MCLAVPGEILEIEGGDPIARVAQVQFGGITKKISLACVPDARIGQFVLVHAGLAISVIDDDEARRVFEYLDSIEELSDLKNGSS